jgi:hypothetical protein
MNREEELIKYIDDIIIQQIYIRCNDQSDITKKDAIKIYWTTSTILASANKCKNVKEFWRMKKYIFNFLISYREARRQITILNSA